MRNSVSVLLIVLCVSMMSFSKIFAAEQGNYVPGVEGIKAASLPPPGFYWRQYYAFYNASTLADQNGDELPVGFDLGVMAVVERFIYVTKKKFLGADYAFDIIVPLQHINLEIDAMGIDDNKFSLGDICIEPFLLSWHGDRYDAACGVGFYAPTGAYDITEPASPGKDHWSTLLTLGTTLYLDPAKTWSLSALGRYEVHGERSETKVTPGNNFLIEWGLAKNACKVWDIGLTGYMQWQLTDDSGTGVTYDKSIHDKVYAMGPELMAFIPPAKLFFSIRTLFEFGAEDRSQGNITTLTLTKIF